MNLIIRFVILLVSLRFKKPIEMTDECITPFRVWPTDLDVLRHVNNGKYFSMMDLARVDLMGRSGVLKKVNELNLYPVVTAGTLRFRRSLTLGQKFEIRTRVLGWDNKFFFLEQKFYRKQECIATGMVKARFMRKSGGSIGPEEMLNEAGLKVPQLVLPEYAKLFSEALEIQAREVFVD